MLNKPSMNRTATKQITKAYNPHLKRTKAQIKSKEEVSKTEEEEINKIKENSENTIILPKEYLAKELIKEGYINSFVDFFYLGWQKTPNMKSKYISGEDEEQIEDQKQEGEEKDEEKAEEDENIPRHEYDLNTLQKYSDILVDAENIMREALILDHKDLNEKAINSYNLISHETVHDQGIPIEAIYFNQKCINLATMYNLVKPLINSLIDMGGCFEKIATPVDMNISKNLKEKAKDIFTQNLAGQEYELENFIYGKLISLYKELAIQQEKMKNYTKAIELLNKLLEVLDSVMGISANLKDSGNEKEKEDIQTESYLTIANLYYKMKDYDHTLETLGKIKELQVESDSGLSNYQIQGLYRYAQTYEMQGNRESAITYLARINKPTTAQTTDDTILAKSLLHLGRLYFKEGTLNLSLDYLLKFYRKSKTIETKELMDIARVNLGMIKGTEGMEEYINQIKNNDYDKFLKDKLEYKQSS